MRSRWRFEGHPELSVLMSFLLSEITLDILNLCAAYLGSSQSVKTFVVAVSSECHTSGLLWKCCTVQGLRIKQKDAVFSELL